jgi:hypothetical protein
MPQESLSIEDQPGTQPGQRIHNALKVTRVEQFFKFFDSVGTAEQASQA